MDTKMERREVHKIKNGYAKENAAARLPKGGMSKGYSRRFPALKVADRTMQKQKVDRSRTELFIKCKPAPVIRKEMSTIAVLMTYSRHYGFTYRATATRWIVSWPSFEVEFMSAADIVKFVQSVK